jgi:carbon-monoxide dehydrogenase large subunit
MHLNTMTTRFGSGQAVQRLEDDQLLKGAGVYTSDVVPAGQAHICFFRSPYAHARIVSIDTSAAKAMPGVHLVVTGKELAEGGYEAHAATC